MPFGHSFHCDFETTDEYFGLLNDHLYLKEWIRTLIERIGMKIHVVDGKEALLIDTWAGEDAPETFGTSIVGFLTTSSFSVHTTDNGILYLDIFSCRDFAPGDIIGTCMDYWGTGISMQNWRKVTRK